MADGDYSGNKVHDANRLAAEVTRQAACKAAGTSQSSVRNADLAYHRAMLASAKANGIQPGVHIQALIELGFGGV